MEEEKRARARNRHSAENPRKGKTRRLEEPPPAAAAAEADSLRGGAAAAALEASDPGEDPGDWEAVPVAIRDSDGDVCGHNICNMDEIDVIVSSIAAVGDPMCEDETCMTTGSNRMMVCSECDLYFCIEESANNRAKLRGHIRKHAFRKAHWVALRFADPNVGYCFKCEDSLTIEKRMMAYDEEDCDETGCANDSGYGCVIRGIPNYGNTCYLNALLQCLLVLGKLRARIFGPDASMGNLGTALHDLFVDTNSVSYAQGLLDPMWLLAYVRRFYPQFMGTSMQDSHELLCCLRNRLNEEEMIMRPPHMQQGAPSAVAPTVIDSIFGGQLSVTTSCKCCSFKSVSQDVFHDLSVPLPPKGTSAKSVASLPRNERRISQNKTCMELFPAIDKINTQKIHAIPEGGDPWVPASELEDMVMVKTSEPLEVDSNHLEQISQGKDDVNGSLLTPIRKESVLIASGHDIERINGAVLDNLFNGPEDSTEANMVTFSAEITTEDKGKARNRGAVYGEAEDINSPASIEECLELHFKEEMIEWKCENCSKVAQKASTISGKDGELMMASTNMNCTVDGDQAEQLDRKTCQSEPSSDLIRLSVECTSNRQPHDSDAQHQVIPTVDIKTSGDTSGLSCGEKDSASCSIANKKPECLEGTQEDVPGCYLAEKLTNLLNGQCQRTSKQDQERGKQVNLGHNSQQLEESQYDRQDRKEGAVKTHLISKLPPVLVIQLKRSLGPLKVSGHVSFKEILDVEPFMDPRSQDKDNSSYRLVGVVEHQGLGTDIGHFVAYVRPSHQQHSSGSSSWFCVSDANINEISVDEVLKCEAYLLFYERMEDVNQNSNNRGSRCAKTNQCTY